MRYLSSRRFVHQRPSPNLEARIQAARVGEFVGDTEPEDQLALQSCRSLWS
jgi:hypothetical protein